MPPCGVQSEGTPASLTSGRCEGGLCECVQMETGMMARTSEHVGKSRRLEAEVIYLFRNHGETLDLQRAWKSSAPGISPDLRGLGDPS